MLLCKPVDHLWEIGVNRLFTVFAELVCSRPALAGVGGWLLAAANEGSPRGGGT